MKYIIQNPEPIIAKPIKLVILGPNLSIMMLVKAP
jgi:hypothetical protein